MGRLGIGVIGVGAMGTSHVVAFQDLPNARVVHVADVSPHRAAAVAQQRAVPRHTTDIESLVSDPDVHAVVIATPEADHLMPAIAALNAGKAVLVEKPLATTAGDAAAIAQLASRVGKHVMVGHTLRFEPRYWMVKQALDRGELGDVVSAYVRRNRPRYLFEQYSRTHPAFETGIHDLDLLLWYTHQRVRRVHATHRFITGKANPDGVWALLEFVGGAIALLESVWLTPNAANVYRADNMELIGTRGSAHVDVSDPGLRFWTEEGQRITDPILEPQPFTGVSAALRAEVAYFTDRVLKDEPPDHVPLTDAVHGIEVVSAIIDAASHGMDVELGIT